MSKKTNEVQKSNEVATVQTAKEVKMSVTQILAQQAKPSGGVSAYGGTVELICEDLTLLNDRAKLESKLAALGVDVKNSKNAINTGVSQTRNVIKLLVSNGLLK